MRTTRRLDAREAESFAIAGEILRTGGLVAFATETVYGLGANALDAAAVRRIFEAKQRPAWDPLIVHVASAEDVALVADVPEALRARVARLAEAFWPGPLTMLLPRNAQVPDDVTAGRERVGVRVPAHDGARRLIAAAGVPVAAPSANRFGHTSPTTAEHVLADLDGRIDAVLDAGATAVGVESTVVDVTETPMVLYRPGAVTAEQLREAAGVEVSVFVPADERVEPEALPSPGVGIRHYAPRARVVLVEGEREVREAAAEGAGVLLPRGWAASGFVVTYPWGPWDDDEALAANLFAGLRALDDAGVETIVVPLPKPGGLRDAIRDRLMKAARRE